MRWYDGGLPDSGTLTPCMFAALANTRLRTPTTRIGARARFQRRMLSGRTIRAWERGGSVVMAGRGSSGLLRLRRPDAERLGHPRLEQAMLSEGSMRVMSGTA